LAANAAKQKIKRI